MWASSFILCSLQNINLRRHNWHNFSLWHFTELKIEIRSPSKRIKVPLAIDQILLEIMILIVSLPLQKIQRLRSNMGRFATNLNRWHLTIKHYAQLNRANFHWGFFNSFQNDCRPTEPTSNFNWGSWDGSVDRSVCLTFEGLVLFCLLADSLTREALRALCQVCHFKSHLAQRLIHVGV